MKGSLAMRKTLKRLLSAVLFVAMALSLVVGVSTAGQAATYPIDIGYAATSGGACDGWFYSLGYGGYITSSNVSSSNINYRLNLVTAFGDTSNYASKPAYFEIFNQNVEGYLAGTMRPLSAPAYIYMQGYNYGTSSLVYSHNQANTTVINGKNYSDSAPYTGTGSSVGTIYKSATTDDLVALSSGNLTFINILLDHRATSGNLDAVFQTGGTLTFSNSTAQVATQGSGIHVQGTGIVDKIENSTVKNTGTSAASTNNKNSALLVGMGGNYTSKVGTVNTITNSAFSSVNGYGIWNRGTIGTISGSTSVTSTVNDAVYVSDSGVITSITGGTFTGGSSGNGLFLSNGGTVGTVSGGVFSSTGANAGINIASGSTLNTISGGTINGITVSGTLGSITGGTFDFTSYKSSYNTIKNSVASGKVARLDSQSGGGKFTVVNNSGITSGTYMSAPSCADGYSATQGTTAINGETFTTYTVGVANIPVQSVEITPSVVNMTIGETCDITVTITPSNATDQTVTWHTSNGGVATIWNRTITANGEGAAVLTATVDGKTAQVTVNVAKPDTRIDVSEYKASGTYPEMSGKLFAGWFADEDYTEPYLETTGLAYAKFVDAGVLVVRGQLSAGTTSASASTNLRLITTVDSDMYSRVGFRITYEGNSVNVETGTVYSSISATDGGLTVSYLPTDICASSKYFMTYVLANVPSAAFSKTISVVPYWRTVDNTLVFGQQSDIVIADQVPDPVIDVESVTLSASTLDMTAGDTSTLTATVSPSNATDKTVTWSSSAPAVASVSGGTVTALSAGQTVITATAGGKSATCTVTVTNATVDSDYIAYMKRTYPNYVESTKGLDITFKEDLVGICYSTWHDYASLYNTGTIYNVTEILAGNKVFGPYPLYHYWAQPALGYYSSSNTSVIRTHMTQLANAGVDFIILDNTNASYSIVDSPINSSTTETYWTSVMASSAKAVLDTCVQMRSEGLKTPYIVFWNRNTDDEAWTIVGKAYSQFINKAEYKDLFVYLVNDTSGKALPLVLGTGSTTSTQGSSEANIPSLYNNMFTYRTMWGLQTVRQSTDWSYLLKNNNQPRRGAYDSVSGKTFYEQMPVAPAMQQAYMSNANTTYPNAIGRQNGATFHTQWQNAFNVRPKIVVLAWWNEWVAQNYGSTSSPTFTDNYNREYSRDIEPMSGGHGAKYYNMMKQYIAAYKAHGTCPNLTESNVSATIS